MQPSHLRVLLLKLKSSCSVLYLCAVPGWFPELQLGCSRCFMQSNHSKESHASSITNMVMIECQDAYQPLWSSLTSPSYYSLLWQQWSSCRYTESYTDSKNAFSFQAEWLYYINQTHHTDNPMPVPTQNIAQNYTEPAWVKQIWNYTHRK